MKKQLLHLKQVLLIGALACTAFANAQVTTFPWTETFEDNSATVNAWTYEYISGTNGSTTNNTFWTIRTTASVGYSTSNGPYQGTKLLDFDTRSFSDHSGRYISPIIDLSSVANPTLNFHYRNKAWGSDQNDLMIYYRTSTTAPWVLIQTLNTNVADWAPSPSINLPSPSSTYQIALVGVAAYGYSINVDNLTISSSNLSVNEANASHKNISLYPNPAKEILYIKSDTPISEFSIFDTNGKTILTSKENTESADIHHLNSGLYILKATDKKGNITTQKFIKE